MGTVVQSLRAVAGSLDLAMVAAPAPAPKARAPNATFDLAPQMDRPTTILVHLVRYQMNVFRQKGKTNVAVAVSDGRRCAARGVFW
ncbi:hypothetical protein HanIR_Chr12g0584601 [Helianthus annuus]|nr:hypothetical protein HanIR_Chr12g0584601 [Helianthus annuus]